MGYIFGGSIFGGLIYGGRINGILKDLFIDKNSHEDGVTITVKVP